jgi:hypothetical protein
VAGVTVLFSVTNMRHVDTAADQFNTAEGKTTEWKSSALRASRRVGTGRSGVNSPAQISPAGIRSGRPPGGGLETSAYHIRIDYDAAAYRFPRRAFLDWLEDCELPAAIAPVDTDQ